MEVDRRTALEATFNLGVDTNLEFIKEATKVGPLFHVMVRARRDAVQALSKLVNVPPTDMDNIRLLQNEVQRFVDLVTFVCNILRESDEAHNQMRTEDADDAEAVRELIETEGEPGDHQ